MFRNDRDRLRSGQSRLVSPTSPRGGRGSGGSQHRAPFCRLAKCQTQLCDIFVSDSLLNLRPRSRPSTSLLDPAARHCTCVASLRSGETCPRIAPLSRLRSPLQMLLNRRQCPPTPCRRTLRGRTTQSPSQESPSRYHGIAVFALAAVSRPPPRSLPSTPSTPSTLGPPRLEDCRLASWIARRDSRVMGISCSHLSPPSHSLPLVSPSSCVISLLSRLLCVCVRSFFRLIHSFHSHHFTSIEQGLAGFRPFYTNIQSDIPPKRKETGTIIANTTTHHHHEVLDDLVSGRGPSRGGEVGS